MAEGKAGEAGYAPLKNRHDELPHTSIGLRTFVASYRAPDDQAQIDWFSVAMAVSTSKDVTALVMRGCGD